MRRFKVYGLLVVSIVFMFILAGCEQTPKGAVKDFYSAMQDKDYQKALTYTVKSNDKKLTFEKFLQDNKWGLDMAMPQLKYKIIKSEVTGNTAKVRVKVTQTDYDQILNDNSTEYIKDRLQKDPSLAKKDPQKLAKDILGPFYKKSLSGNTSKKTKEVVIYLKKDKAKWVLIDNGFLEEAILGYAENAFNPPPELTVVGFLEALKARDLDLANSYTYTIDKEKINLGNEKDMVETIISHLNYKVKTKLIKEKEAKVKVNLTSPDFVKLFNADELKSYITQRLTNEPGLLNKPENEVSQQLFMDFIKEKLNNSNIPTITRDITLNLTAVGDKWLLDNDDKLLNAIVGNMEEVKM